MSLYAAGIVHGRQTFGGEFRLLFNIQKDGTVKDIEVHYGKDKIPTTVKGVQELTDRFKEIKFSKPPASQSWPIEYPVSY